MSKRGREKDLWNRDYKFFSVKTANWNAGVYVFCHRCRNTSTPPSKLKIYCDVIPCSSNCALELLPQECLCFVISKGNVHWLTCLIQSFTTRSCLLKGRQMLWVLCWFCLGNNVHILQCLGLIEPTVPYLLLQKPNKQTNKQNNNTTTEKNQTNPANQPNTNSFWEIEI